MRNVILAYLLGLCTATLLCVGCTTIHAAEIRTVSVPQFVWDQARFEEWVEALDQGCPLNAEVLVEVLDLPPGYLGLARWDAAQNKYILQIDSAQPMQGIRDTLMHEWAHAMVWDATKDPDEDHGPMWGVAQAHAYRVLETLIGPPS